MVSPTRSPLLLTFAVCAFMAGVGASVVSMAAQEGGPDAAERLFFDAQRFEQDGDLDAALREYVLITEQFPTSVVAAPAWLAVALARWSRGNADAALEAVSRLQTDHREAPATASSYVVQGDIGVALARRSADIREARATFGRVPVLYAAGIYPGLEARAEALRRSGELSLQLGELDEAAAAFLSAIEDEPPWAGREGAELGLATVLLRQGDWVSSAATLQRIVDAAVDESTVVAEARRRLSLIHRMILRPQLGQSPWLTARPLQLVDARLDDPIGVSVSTDGRLLVVDEGVSQAFLADDDRTVRTRRQVDDLRLPFWSPSGLPFVLNKRVAFTEALGGQQVFQAPRGDDVRPLENLAAGARGLFGQWYLVDTDPRRLMMFDREGSYQSTLMDGRRAPLDVATDAGGRLFVLQELGNSVVRFDGDGGGEVRLFTGTSKRPYALDVDELGNVYVLDRDDKIVQVFDVNGDHIRDIGPVLPGGVELRDPRDVAVDGTGRLYIADRGADSVMVLE